MQVEAFFVSVQAQFVSKRKASSDNEKVDLATENAGKELKIILVIVLFQFNWLGDFRNEKY